MRARNTGISLQSALRRFGDKVRGGKNEARAKAEFVDVITPFEEILGKENVLVNDGEFSIRNPNEGFKQILEFIGVDKEALEFEIDEEKGFPCLVKPAKR